MSTILRPSDIAQSVEPGGRSLASADTQDDYPISDDSKQDPEHMRLFATEQLPRLEMHAPISFHQRAALRKFTERKASLPLDATGRGFRLNRLQRFRKVRPYKL